MASLLLRSSRIKELLHALHHAATLVALQVLQLFCCRLGSSNVLLGRGVSRAVSPRHAGNGGSALPDGAHAAGLASSRRATDGTVDFTLVGLREAAHGGQLLRAIEERFVMCLQRLAISVFGDGCGQVLQCCLQRILAVLTRVLAMANDKHLRDGAAATVRARKRIVDDHHIGGERVERCRVGVDEHRVGGADRLQVVGRLVGDVELVEEADKAALGAICARVRCGLVGEANLANKIGEAGWEPFAWVP